MVKKRHVLIIGVLLLIILVGYFLFNSNIINQETDSNSFNNIVYSNQYSTDNPEKIVYHSIISNIVFNFSSLKS